MASSSSIIGHTSQIESLLQDLSADNVAHAYLLLGRAHIGKFTVAKWFARTLLLSDARDEAAGERIEHEIDHLLHPDLLVIDQLWMEDVCEDFEQLAKSSNVPQQHRAKAGAKTDTISIDDIRALQDRLLEVGRSRYRCCLIREAARLQEEAVNALLKILEEPPPGVVFLLTAESSASLLPTLISRSRVMRFSALPQREMAPLVGDVSEEDAAFLLRLAQGAPGVILRLKRDPDALRSARLRYASALSFWGSTSLSERLTLLAPLLERGEEASQLLLHLALSLREDQSSSLSQRSQELHRLIHALHTNASRPLLVQRFALSI